MRFRKLRIAWSVTWGMVAVLLCMLWVRSYSVNDNLYLKVGKGRSAWIGSLCGRLAFLEKPAAELPEFEKWWLDHSAVSTGEHLNVSTGAIVLPLWLPVLFAALFGLAPWIRRRFSLRTLLIAATVVAVVLGIVVWATRH
jgi:hypothetical protein